MFAARRDRSDPGRSPTTQVGFCLGLAACPEQIPYPEITNYTYHGKILTHMTVDYTDFDEVAHQDEMHFFYDAQSRPVKVEFNGTVYTYLPNLQGDIVGIIDSNGSLVVEYKYDAWGKPLSTTGTLAGTLGKRNPFRYRGYVYDEETEFYCLTNRYYNVGWKRFINPDDLFAANLFMYGQNNPISFDDPSGNLARNAIHNAVQRDLRRRYPALISEVAVIKGSGGAGRIDLLNQYTGQIWEIKPNTRPSYYANGAAQLRNYARGRLLNYPKLRMRIGGPLKAGMFIYHVGRDIASVKYWYAGAGVILYSYKILRKGEPSKSTIPVPYSDRQEKDDSNSNPQTNIIPFPVQNEGQDETIAAIAAVCVVAIVLVGASCLTGIPFWTVFAF